MIKYFLIKIKLKLLILITFFAEDSQPEERQGSEVRSAPESFPLDATLSGIRLISCSELFSLIKILWLVFVFRTVFSVKNYHWAFGEDFPNF